MTDTLAEALRALVGYFDGDDIHLGNALVDACNALAAYDAKREAALQELADLGSAWDAAPAQKGEP